MRRFTHVLSFLMVIAGVALLLTVAALYYFQSTNRDRDNRAIATMVGSSNGASAPSEVTPTAWQASRIHIPRLDLDSPLVEVTFEDGEWKVPELAAGHLVGTANPGGTGNVILIGHLNDIAGDRVFARLKELNIGDEVLLSGESNTLDYAVTTVEVVKKDDMSVLMPTSEATLTLITCAGIFNPFTWDYPERLVVIAKPVGN